VIVLNERHLIRIQFSCFSYYHLCRAYWALDRDAPAPREVKPTERGRVVAWPQGGGLC
jgi:hypothetical protein